MKITNQDCRAKGTSKLALGAYLHMLWWTFFTHRMQSEILRNKRFSTWTCTQAGRINLIHTISLLNACSDLRNKCYCSFDISFLSVKKSKLNSSRNAFLHTSNILKNKGFCLEHARTLFSLSNKLENWAKFASFGNLKLRWVDTNYF